MDTRLVARPSGRAAARLARPGGARVRARRPSRGFPPLVFAGEARALTTALGHAAEGRAFLLQAGDCAESFDAFSRRQDPRQAAGHPADVGRAHLLVGRARRSRSAASPGQFAKPRSAPTERVGDVELPVVPRRHRERRRADAPRPGAPIPARLVQAYHQSASTLNLLRAFTKGGFADLVPRARVEPGVRRAPAARASATRRWPTRSTARCGSCARAASTSRPTHQLHQVDFYTSHEALILGYEEALTRRRLASPASGTTARRTCSGSASAPASSTARTSSSCAASATRSA